MTTEQVWEQEAECDACDGTGVYVGFAEKSGGAVVCARCKGSGKRTIRVTWKHFEGRKRRVGVRRVVETNPGYCIGDGPECSLEDFGGMPYEAWLRGDPFPKGSEMRQACPKWWAQSTNQRFEYEPCNRSIGLRFACCKHFTNRSECWAEWDRRKR